MPMEVSSAPPPMSAPAAPVAPPVAPDTARLQFIAEQRAEARRLEGTGSLSSARQHWRYVLALLPDDADARQQIARLDGVIRTKRDAALAQGEAAVMRGQTAAAQTAFLRVLALDGANDQARRRLLELETRAAFQRQDRKDARARAARAAGMETPEDDGR
jgi:nitroreductase